MKLTRTKETMKTINQELNNTIQNINSTLSTKVLICFLALLSLPLLKSDNYLKLFTFNYTNLSRGGGGSSLTRSFALDDVHKTIYETALQKR